MKAEQQNQENPAGTDQGGENHHAEMVKDFRRPGMMTLIGLAITVVYAYSSAVVFGLSGKVFFWELATLIDVMLLGHWIEMRSVMGTSQALEELVKLMPSTAHLLQENGSTKDVPCLRTCPGVLTLLSLGRNRLPDRGLEEPPDSDIRSGRL